MDFDSLNTEIEGAQAKAIDQYLTFEIDKEIYGIDILKIREIRGWGAVREVPNTPDYMKGVINLRGTMIPVVDMRLRFGMKEVEYTPITVVIVVSIVFNNKEILVAFVVDAVSDVIDIGRDDFRAVPTFGCKIEARYMTGMAIVNEKTIILLNTDEVMEEHEFEELCEVG